MARRTIMAAIVLSLLVAGLSGCSPTASYPNKAIQLVIPYAPGGATDIIYRIVAEKLQTELKQPIAVVNVAGASATTGSRQVKDAKPDGYTILGSHDVIATAYYADVVDYAFEAFEPICLLTSTPNIATTSTQQPWTTMTELLADAQENPGTIVWSTTLGSTDHYYIMGLLAAAGLDQDVLRLTGYEGTGEQITALLGNHTMGCMTNVASAEAYVESGEMRFIGVAHDERLATIPDVPTMKEQGIDFVHGTNRGVFAPKGTPKEIITKLEAAFKKVMTDPGVIAKIEEIGTIVNFMGTADYKVFLDETMELYGELTELIEGSK